MSPFSREPVGTDRKCVARIAQLTCLLYIITPSPGSAPVYSVNFSLTVSTAVINNACRLYTVSRLKAPCVLINRLLAFPSRELTISFQLPDKLPGESTVLLNTMTQEREREREREIEWILFSFLSYFHYISIWYKT